jgi:NADH-quinone oxidoreductase subunit M
METLPLLSLIVLLPFAGAVAVALAGDRAARSLSAATLTLAGAACFAVLLAFDPSQADFQLLETRLWIPSLGIHYRLGVDGISLFFLPLSVLLFAGIAASDWRTPLPMARLYHALLLSLLGCTLGIFLALDTMLFFLFWELSLLPLYFLITLWGPGKQRAHAAGQYLLIMLASGAFLLFGFLVAAHAGGGWQFGLPELIANPASRKTQWLIFLLLVAGFAAKIPVVPLHTWLPVLSLEGPVAAMASLIGLKLGAYGLLRFALPLAPQVAPQLHWLLAGLGTVGILYGAVAAVAQTNLRRLLAYAGVSHVGLVLVGLAAFNERGLTGAVMLLQSFTLTAGGLFVLCACVHRRCGSTDVVDLGGLAASAPRLAALFLLFGLAGLGLPGLAAFPAELAIILAALQTHTGAGLAALFGAVVGAAAFVALYRRAFYGPSGSGASIPDLRPRELAYALVVAALLLGAGLWPSLVIDTIAPAVQRTASAWSS